MTRHGGGVSVARTQRALDWNLPKDATAALEISSNAPATAASAPLGQVVATAVPFGHGPVKIDGFRHFLSDDDTLPIDKQFRVHGEDPLRSDDSVKNLRTLMSGLAMRMSLERRKPWTPHGTPGLEPWENPNLPAGYTYLLQLIAHDLVQTSYPMSILEDSTTGVRNDRTYRLKLDTIYSGGPQVCPFAYAIDESSSVRSALRVGPRNVKDEDKPMIPLNRDIARLDSEVRQEHGNDATPLLTEPLIPDPRNDDHAILAQLTALFHHLHNGLMRLLPEPAAMAMADSTTEAAFDRFLCARGAVTLMYRNVVKNDVMKRLLHHDIYVEYSSEDPQFLTAGLACVPNSPTQSENGAPRREFLVPLEFTHGAFRFGHAMVRDAYRMNARENSVFATDEVLRHNSLLRPSEMPLNRRWIVEWSRFFDLSSGSGPPQYSHRIGPHLSGGLNHEALFHEIDFTGRQGIAYRDLMSAAFVRLWSVNALIEEIRGKRPDLIAKSPLLRDQTHRRERLHAWLKVDQSLSGLTSDQINALADDPPLLFFIQFEAANEADLPADRGHRLGILGSIIVAEVIFGAFAGDPLPIEALRRSLADAKSRHPQGSFEADRLGEVEGISTMAQLVEFTAEVANLTSADPAFL